MTLSAKGLRSIAHSVDLLPAVRYLQESFARAYRGRRNDRFSAPSSELESGMTLEVYMLTVESCRGGHLAPRTPSKTTKQRRADVTELAGMSDLEVLVEDWSYQWH